jgi:hypothetical protein
MNNVVLGPILALLLVASACSSSGMDRYQRRGERLCGELVAELKEVDGVEELMEKEGVLEKKFQQLVDTMIALASSKRGDPLAAAPMGRHAKELQSELIRIYAIEGASEIIERAQRESLIRLGAFDRKLVLKYPVK